ncbi:MAG: hypothetical protein LIP10_03585 [Clostridiales bacterium]|nr:hypothetical protein [Clostridiales bacterium]
MDREKFKAAMESEVHGYITEKSYNCLKPIAATEDWKTNATWLIEEMAELQQALVKNLRGFDNMDDVLQEMADVWIGIQLMSRPDKNGYIGIDATEVNRAINVKLDRDLKRIEDT